MSVSVPEYNTLMGTFSDLLNTLVIRGTNLSENSYLNLVIYIYLM